MALRPAVLFVDPQADRLRDLGVRLAAEGYEVVPVGDAARAKRFAEGLDQAVIVTTLEALAAGVDLNDLLSSGSAGGSGRRTLVVIGHHPAEEEALPEEVSFLAVGGFDLPEVARRLLMALLGRELGLAPDARLASLVGDLGQTPLIELLRGLATAKASGRLDLRGGSLLLQGGEVAAAAAGPVRGLKAFCRLGRLHEGPVRFVPGDFPARREIEDSLDSLVFAAIDDSLGEFPDPRLHLEVEIGPAFFSTPFTPLQQRILGAAQRGATLRQILDGLPDRDGEIVQEVLRLEERGLLLRREPGVMIVTDSTSDLPPDLAASHGIAVVPLTLDLDGTTFRDRVDLQPGQFYALLERTKAHPASNLPLAEDFARLYGEWLGQGHDVVSIHLSARLSKTVERATAGAAAALAGRDSAAGQPPAVSVVDSTQASLGLGLLVLFAARMAARNETALEIRRRLLAMAPRVHTLFVVDTLEYLARGGRIGRAQALLGGLLGIKPILGVVDGEITAVDKVRGGRATHPRILEILKTRLNLKQPLVAGVSHGNAPAWADRLERRLRDTFQITELIQAEVGPVVGTHSGPGVVAVSVFQPEADETALIAPL
ncbi:MAG TPA: DegV family protein [Thermoanaerobaculia bacterium]|nr:DegV family protein [Thermoanaerobaculia bacterium]